MTDFPGRKKQIQRIAALALAAIMIMAAAGCASGNASNTQSAESSDVQAQESGREAAAVSGTDEVPAAEAPGGTGSPAEEEGAAEEKDAANGTDKQETSAGQETGSGLEDVEIPEVPYTRDDGGVSLDVFAMDTYMTLLAYGDRAEDAVTAAAAEIHRLDEMLSTGNVQSEISRLNAAGSSSTAGDGSTADGGSGKTKKTDKAAEKETKDTSSDSSAPGGTEVSNVVLHLIEEAQILYKETDGLFDIAIYPVMKLWGFPTQEYRIPEKAELDKALKLADPSAITVQPLQPAAQNVETSGTAGTAGDSPAPEKADQTENTEKADKTDQADQTENTDKANQADKTDQADSAAAVVRFGIPGMEIDLGGIAKGYTSSRVMEIYQEYGIEHGLVSLGGNVQALGTKENGKPWRVAIQNPQSELDYLGVLDIDNKCVITSGGYERFFEQDGVRYHHIIDPRTGYPADSGIISATIISEDGTLADGLSTSLFIMGKDKAEEFWREHPGQFDYILEDSDGTLYVTKGAADILTTDAEKVIIQ